MRILKCIGALVLACAIAPAGSAQWLDDFDGYSAGPLAAQSLWDEWTGSSGVDASVTTARSFTTPNSVLIVKDNDVVYDFANLTGGRPSKGVWVASVKTFVPFSATGIGWYILLNDYPSPPKWSVQTSFDATNALVSDGSVTTRLKFNRWVTFVVAIDLDNDRYDSWYDNAPLVVNGNWSSGGQKVIAALDLYGDAGGLSAMYFDNSKLEAGAGGPLALTSAPNPVGSGFTLNLYSESPLLGNGDPGVLFTWSLNGSPLILPLFTAAFDAAGEWKLGTTVPAGLTGLEVGLRMIALPSGGKVLLSNEDVIIFL